MSRSPYFKIFILLMTAFMGFQCVSEKSTLDGAVIIKESFQGMAAFGLNPDTWEVEAYQKPLVIRDDNAYNDFIDIIPEEEMTPQNPPPPSDDPLLERPEIDFKKNMMLVIFSYDPNTFISLSIQDVAITGEKMVVTTYYEQPDPLEIQQKIISYGLYYAVVVPRFDGEVIFKNP